MTSKNLTKAPVNYAESVTIGSSVPGEVFQPSITGPVVKEEAKARLKRFEEEETRKVRGIFQFFECPGMEAQISVRKYKGHYFQQSMRDGQEYEVPLYVARFLNGIDITAQAIDGKVGTCSYPVHSFIMDKNGFPIPSVAQTKKRFGFQSLEFAGSLGAVA